jgi:tubulin polyglutamylase TTLL1
MSSRIICRSDLEKAVITGNFERRGWHIQHSDSTSDDWNVYWASVHTIKYIFSSESGVRLRDDQILNHFPNHYELTRKDLMAKNIKRYRREADRDGTILESEPGAYDFVPQTYNLPGDYAIFVEEFRREGGTWIVKPSARSQGAGIFLVDKLAQLKKWAKGPLMGQGRDSYVISRYIDRPLLVGGRKFDLRMYALVTSFRPLMVYLYKLGFGRFCTVKFMTDNINDPFMHLTNVAIQKHGEDYSEQNGGKWALAHFRLYIEGTRGKAAADKLFNHDIPMCIVLSLKAVQSVIIADKHCFECYGYDILVDEDLKPWLIEVNASPSLTTTTPTDRNLKMSLINDVFNIVLPPEFPNVQKGRGGINVYPREDMDMGNFEVLYDESAEVDAERIKREAELMKKFPPKRPVTAFKAGGSGSKI